MTRTQTKVADLTLKDRLAYAFVAIAFVLASLFGFAGLAVADDGEGSLGHGGDDAVEAVMPDINLGSGVSGNGEVEDADEADEINLSSGVSGNGEEMLKHSIITKDETKFSAQLEGNEVDFDIEVKLEATMADPHKLVDKVLTRLMLSKDEIMKALKVENNITEDELIDDDEVLPSTEIESKVVIDKTAGTSKFETKLSFEAIATTPAEAVDAIFMKLSALTAHDIFSAADITIK